MKSASTEAYGLFAKPIICRTRAAINHSSINIIKTRFRGLRAAEGNKMRGQSGQVRTVFPRQFIMYFVITFTRGVI